MLTLHRSRHARHALVTEEKKESQRCIVSMSIFVVCNGNQSVRTANTNGTRCISRTSLQEEIEDTRYEHEVSTCGWVAKRTLVFNSALFSQANLVPFYYSALDAAEGEAECLRKNNSVTRLVSCVFLRALLRWCIVCSSPCGVPCATSGATFRRGC